MSLSKELVVYNSISREKELFQPLKEGFIGMYVCGPTVYNNVHLGNCRTFTSFDIIYRYLRHLGYRVRYVRNITDVGHLLDDGEDRMLKGAEREQLQPMEIAQKYTVGFHDMMQLFNNLPPTIEPTATGHIIEQIEMTQQILDKGLAYVQNGSVYLDIQALLKVFPDYGKLSGRVLEDLFTETRELKNQGEKRHPADFALWMKASPEHIMRWNSPWSVGFPGWHLECSAMSTKYLGKQFDIHGGGMDLQFPHHENEIAQNVAACDCTPVRYWLHANMLVLNGKRMSKSENHTILPMELFTGENKFMSKPYSPMTMRFFMLQAHYRSTLNITDEALAAAEKGYARLMDAYAVAQKLVPAANSTAGEEDKQINALLDAAFAEMSDDFNTPNALAQLFGVISKIYSLRDGHIDLAHVSAATLQRMKTDLQAFIFDIFGLKDESKSENGDGKTVEGLMQLLIDIRQKARENKDWGTSDKIRIALQEIGIQLKDGKESVTWTKS